MLVASHDFLGKALVFGFVEDTLVSGPISTCFSVFGEGVLTPKIPRAKKQDDSSADKTTNTRIMVKLVFLILVDVL